MFFFKEKAVITRLEQMGLRVEKSTTRPFDEESSNKDCPVLYEVDRSCDETSIIDGYEVSKFSNSLKNTMCSSSCNSLNIFSKRSPLTLDELISDIVKCESETLPASLNSDTGEDDEYEDLNEL